MTRRALALVSLVAVLLVSSGAAAQRAQLDRARRLYVDADFRAAVTAFEELLARRDLRRDVAAEAHLHLTALSLALGLEARAREHAEAAVALDPRARPPEGAPPSMTRLLLEARSRVGTPLAIAFRLHRRPVRGRAVRVEARATPAAPRLVSAVALRCTPAAAARREGRWVALVVPRVGTSLSCSAAGETAAGARLVQADARWNASEPPSGGLGPWPWIGGAAVVVAALAAVVVGVVVSRGDNPRIDVVAVDL